MGVNGNKPNCYECKYRGDVPGSAHSCCNHPKAKSESDNPLGELLSILGGPLIPTEGFKNLSIKGNAHGIRKGWFSWPYNFDPVWLENCNGFTAEAPNSPTTTQTGKE